MVKDFGKWVHCTSYLKPVRDGRCLDMVKDDKGNITEVHYIGNGNDVPDKCNCEGSLEFLKTYYEKRSAEFDGVLVGAKKIVIDGYLWADTEYHPYRGGGISNDLRGCSKCLQTIDFTGYYHKSKEK